MKLTPARGGLALHDMEGARDAARGLPAASDRPGSRMGRDGLGCSRTTGPPTHPVKRSLVTHGS